MGGGNGNGRDPDDSQSDPTPRSVLVAPINVTVVRTITNLVLALTAITEQLRAIAHEWAGQPVAVDRYQRNQLTSSLRDVARAVTYSADTFDKDDNK